MTIKDHCFYWIKWNPEEQWYLYQITVDRINKRYVLKRSPNDQQKIVLFEDEDWPLAQVIPCLPPSDDE